MHKDIPSVIDYQWKDYPRNIREEDSAYVIVSWGEYKVPFTFATNGRPYLEQLRTKSGIWFQDLRNPAAAPKALRGWMSPIGIQELLEKDIQIGDQNLKDMSYDFLRDKAGLNLRDYQVNAIQAADNDLLVHIRATAYGVHCFPSLCLLNFYASSFPQDCDNAWSGRKVDVSFYCGL